MPTKYPLNKFLKLWEKDNYDHLVKVIPLNDKQGDILVTIENSYGEYTKKFSYLKIVDEFDTKVKINQIGVDGSIYLNSDVKVIDNNESNVLFMTLARLIDHITYKDFDYIPEHIEKRIKDYLKFHNEEYTFVVKDSDEILPHLKPLE